MENFWENKHKTNNNYWLTGSDPIKVLKMHEIPVNLKNQTILDIGIGKGSFAKFISNTNDLISVDISSNALKKVQHLCEVHNVSELSNIRPVDIAICHLVFQHCNDETITNIINDVQLKDNGMFSFQFAYLRTGEEPNLKVKGLIKDGTHHFRSLEILENIIKTKTNKKIVYISKPMHWNNTENFSWLFVKVTNK